MPRHQGLRQRISESQRRQKSAAKRARRSARRKAKRERPLAGNRYASAKLFSVNNFSRLRAFIRFRQGYPNPTEKVADCFSRIREITRFHVSWNVARRLSDAILP